MNEQRVARVRAEMQAHGLTQMIISDSKSIWYLTGASVEPYERLMALYLPVQGEPVIFLNKLFFVPQAPAAKCGTLTRTSRWSRSPKWWTRPRLWASTRNGLPSS